MKILIVENDTLIQDQLKECLEDLNQDVLGIVSSGEDAIVFATNNKPDFVFMDIDLDGAMDGIKCAEHLSADLQIPSVFLTTLRDELSNSMEADALAFLPKPFTDELIEKTLGSVRRKLRLETIEVAHSEQTTVTLGAYEFNSVYDTLRCENENIKLNAKEISFIKLFFENVNNTVSKETLMNTIEIPSDGALKQVITRLRKKIPGLKIVAEPNNGYFIRTDIKEPVHTSHILH